MFNHPISTEHLLCQPTEFPTNWPTDRLINILTDYMFNNTTELPTERTFQKTTDEFPNHPTKLPTV